MTYRRSSENTDGHGRVAEYEMRKWSTSPHTHLADQDYDGCEPLQHVVHGHIQCLQADQGKRRIAGVQQGDEEKLAAPEEGGGEERARQTRPCECMVWGCPPLHRELKTVGPGTGCMLLVPVL